MDQQPNHIQEHNTDSDMQIISHELSFSGPLPPPGVLREYENILPGSAAKIIDAASKQSQHRQDLEAKVLHWDIVNSRLGLIFGLVIGMAGLTASVIIAKSGQQAASSIIGGGTLVALVGSFVYGSQGKGQPSQDQETDQTQQSSGN